MVISFRMPVLDNGTTFPGPIPYALPTRKSSFLYSMLEIALTPSSLALSGRGNVGGIANVAWTPGIPPEDNIAVTISRPVSIAVDFHMRFDRGRLSIGSAFTTLWI